MSKSRLWTREELILAFNLYLILPFGKLHSRNPEVIKLANLINRTPGSIAIRLTNFAACDPYHQARGIKGMEGGIKQCQPIWNEFNNDNESLIFESEQIRAELEKQPLEIKFKTILNDVKNLKGEDKIRTVKTRINQHVFRKITLVNYSNQCAISGIDISDFLVASHIMPWSVNEKERLNPENGICLSSLYDKAFDKGYISIDNKMKILVSNELIKHESKVYFNQHFAHLQNKKISTPEKYKPNPQFLKFHRENIFKG